MKKILFFLFVFIFCQAKAQINFGNRWTELPYEEGANCVLADGNYIWFGAGFGLVKLNRLTGEKKYYTFINVPVMPCACAGPAGIRGSTQVTCLAKDDSGNIYAGICSNIYKFDGNKWTFLFHQSEISAVYIQSMVYTTDNKLWFITTDGPSPYWYYDFNTGKTQSSSIPYGFKFALKDGSTWRAVSTTYGPAPHDSTKLVKFDKNSTRTDSFIVGTNSQITSLYEDGKGTFWYTKNNGGARTLCCRRNNSTTYYTIPAIQGTSSGTVLTKTSPNGDLYLDFYGQAAANQSVLMSFNGLDFHVFDSSEIHATPTHFIDMDFAADSSLWLAANPGNGAYAENNVFHKTASDNWSSIYFADFYIPGSSGVSNSNYVGTDSLGNAYYAYGNTLSTIDNNMSVTINEFADSISLLSSRSAVEKNGTVWIEYGSNKTSNINFAKIYKGNITVYNAIPPYQSGYVTQLVADSRNHSVFMLAHSSQAPYYTSIYEFNGTYSLVSNEGYPATYNPYFLAAYDNVNKELLYNVIDTSKQSSTRYIVKYNGVTNTAYPYSHFPGAFNYSNPSIVIDKTGNKWFLNQNLSNHTLTKLCKWNSNTDSIASYSPRAPYVLDGNSSYSLFYSQSNNSICNLAYASPYDNFAYLLQFDGNNWSYNTLDLKPLTGATQGPSASIPVYAQGDLFCFSFPNDLIVLNSEGTFNNPSNTNNSIDGTVYYDLNLNNRFDDSDIAAKAICVNANTNSSLTNWNGYYLIQTDSGKYPISVVPPEYYTAKPVLDSVNFHQQTGHGVTKYFALQPVGKMNDLSVTVTAMHFRPGSYGWYSIHYKNKGTTVQTANLALSFDKKLNYLSSSHPPVDSSNNTLHWNLGTLRPSSEGILVVYLNVPSSLPLNTPLNSVATITSLLRDTFPSDNMDTINHVTSASHDPNKKTVTPAGIGNNGVVDTSQQLTYTIYFQNTGNDTALTVRILDTLDTNLDLGTFNLISSSSPVQFYFAYPNAIQFVFENIMLPDSNHNEPASNGFITYSIKSKKGVSIGTNITNRASVYFDYNQPVITNTVQNTIGLKVITQVISNYQNMHIKLYPNPSNGRLNMQLDEDIKNGELQVTDITGKILATNEIHSKLSSFNLNYLPAGIYLVKIKVDSRLIGTGKIIIVN